MNELKAPSLLSLLGSSDKGSTDSLLAESLQFDMDELDDAEYSIPPAGELPTLAAVLSEFEADSDIASELGVTTAPTPTPSIAEDGGGGVRGGGAGGGGSIMRYTMLQGVSAQVSSAADRVNAGLATACAVSALIAVGTSHGHILNFDITQTLRWAHQDKHGQGAVTALAFNPDCTRLLAGYARGLIAMFDTQSGDVLRQLLDAVTPNSGVLHAKWTSRTALALAADAGGSVWSLSFTRKLGIRGCASRCLFSGARGEVCVVEPLVTDSGGGGQHDLDQYCIVALATLSKYFIVMIRPRLKVIKYHALVGPADCLPVLAWQMVLIQAADTTRSVDPVLVVGRGTQLYFHQLFVSTGRITLLFLRHVQLQTNLLSAHWLGPKCVGCLDTSEILHLFDVRNSRELECIDVANAGLVYGSAQFKGLATGGNVSPALALAGTHACYNSLAARGSQLYVLGPRSLHMIGVRSWTERIGYLVKNQRWQEACDIALDGYRAAAERPKRRAQARERILMLFAEYLAASARAPDYCLGPIVKCLIAIGELDLLWTQLWERLQDNNTGLFLQHISEHIEQERLQHINPAISQALVDYWLRHSPAKLEELILKLDWSCLDLNQVLKAVRQYRLYRAQIYLNTHALSDYTVSLTELIPLLAADGDAADTGELGNCLLVYISSCLAGRGYPRGALPVELVHSVKHDVLRCLTSLHSLHGASAEAPYPYLRALLKHDTRETLNVISLAFQEAEFSGELGFSQRKRIIDILLAIMTPDNATWAEIGCLLNFIAQQISQQCLPCDTQLLEQVLAYVSMPHIDNETTRQHAERESAWHELLANNCLAHISSDVEQLALAKRAHCHCVEEQLLERLQRYDNILACYLDDGGGQRHAQLFDYMERHAAQPQRRIYEQLREHIKRLLRINAKELVRLIDAHYIDRLDELLAAVRDDEQSLYIFLQHLHRRREALSSAQCEELLALICRHGDEAAVLELLGSGTAAYRTEAALALVQRHGHARAAIYLYERQQNYAAAFERSMELLAAADAGAEAAACALQVSGLCARASAASSSVGGASSLSTPQALAQQCWFALLRAVLPRDDLKAITKSLLHQASQHVDLPSLVQLVMRTQHVSGSFGDIKDLLLSMLSNSRYEGRAMQLTARIQAAEMHDKLARRRREACRGLLVTWMRCALCHNRLYNQTCVLVLGACGHAMHEDCAQRYDAEMLAAVDIAHHSSESTASDDEDTDGAASPRVYRCPRCQAEMLHATPLQLSQPSHCVFGDDNATPTANPASLTAVMNLDVLPVKAPPRRF